MLERVRPWAIPLIVVAITTTLAVAVGFRLQKEQTRHHLVRCWLPNGLMYPGYTKGSDLDITGVNLKMVDAQTGEALRFVNTVCMVSYDRTLPGMAQQ